MNLSKSPSANRYFGCHVSSSGGLTNAIKNGEALGVNTIQLHPSAPQRWNGSGFTAEQTEAFQAACKASTIVEKVFFHAIYLINLASPNAQQVHLSKVSLINYLNLCSAIEGQGVIVHVGSMKDEPDETVGLKRAAEAIDDLLTQAVPGAQLLLEVAAGSGAVVGDRMEELAIIRSQVAQKERVGFALDTQHLWASGYDYASDLEGFVTSASSILGLENIKAIHFNDSKTELASRKDRHENLGEGLIGRDALHAFFNHPSFAPIPFILETPAMKDMATAAAEVEKLRGYVA